MPKSNSQVKLNTIRRSSVTKDFTEEDFDALVESWFGSGRTLSLAESCTGGLLSAKICSKAGVSSLFLGSAVTYSDAMKTALLGVAPKTLTTYGAVSQQCALEMVAGIQRVSKSDIAVAITGIAGPSGGSAEKPVGTVWIAVKFGKEKAKANCYFFEGMSRIEVQTSACRIALEAICKY